MVIIGHEAVRLDAVDEPVLLLKLPIERGGVAVVVPESVKPDAADFAVIGEEFPELGVHEIVICLPVRLGRILSGREAGASGRIVIPSPVNVGVVEMKPYALLVAFVSQLFQHIPSERGCIDDIVRRLPGAEHRESVVMPGGEADVLCPGSLDGGNPLGGIEISRIECRSCLGVLLVLYPVPIEIPFALGEHAVDSPMEEDSELVPGEFRPGFEILPGRNIALSLGRI